MFSFFLYYLAVAFGRDSLSWVGPTDTQPLFARAKDIAKFDLDTTVGGKESSGGAGCHEEKEQKLSSLIDVDSRSGVDNPPGVDPNQEGYDYAGDTVVTDQSQGIAAKREYDPHATFENITLSDGRILSDPLFKSGAYLVTATGDRLQQEVLQLVAEARRNDMDVLDVSQPGIISITPPIKQLIPTPPPTSDPYNAWISTFTLPPTPPPSALPTVFTSPMSFSESGLSLRQSVACGGDSCECIAGYYTCATPAYNLPDCFLGSDVGGIVESFNITQVGCLGYLLYGGRKVRQFRVSHREATACNGDDCANNVTGAIIGSMINWTNGIVYTRIRALPALPTKTTPEPSQFLKKSATASLSEAAAQKKQHRSSSAAWIVAKRYRGMSCDEVCIDGSIAYAQVSSCAEVPEKDVFFKSSGACSLTKLCL